MYTVQSAVGVRKVSQSRWGTVDVSTISVLEIFNTYRELYLTLEANFTPDPIFVNIETFRLKYSTFEGTVEEMFDDNGNETFETITEIPLKTTKFAKFADMNQVGYKVLICGRNSPPEAGIPRADKIDLRIHRDNPATDMQNVYDYCMINVNGYWHFTDTDGEYLYVHEGGKATKQYSHCTLGMLSFAGIGKIKQVAITEDMLYKQQTNSRLYDTAYFKLPDDVDIEGKTVLMSVGGYLVMPDQNTLRQTGERTFSLKLKNLPLVERYYESRNWIDYEALGLDGSSRNESLINMTQFYSDAVMTKYLTMSQTFFVVVDTPELWSNKLFVARKGLPGMYTSGFEPQQPLMIGRGRVGVYWKIQEDGVWTMNVENNYLNRRVFGDLTTGKRVNVADSAFPSRPAIESHGYLLEIGTDFAPA